MPWKIANETSVNSVISIMILNNLSIFSSWATIRRASIGSSANFIWYLLKSFHCLYVKSWFIGMYWPIMKKATACIISVNGVWCYGQEKAWLIIKPKLMTAISPIIYRLNVTTMLRLMIIIQTTHPASTVPAIAIAPILKCSSSSWVAGITVRSCSFS